MNFFLCLAVDIDGSPQMVVVICDDLLADYQAGNIIRDLAKEIKGGGGGQPFFATAGGKDIGGLGNVIVKAKGILGL